MDDEVKKPDDPEGRDDEAGQAAPNLGDDLSRDTNPAAKAVNQVLQEKTAEEIFSQELKAALNQPDETAKFGFIKTNIEKIESGLKSADVHTYEICFGALYSMAKSSDVTNREIALSVVENNIDYIVTKVLRPSKSVSLLHALYACDLIIIFVQYSSNVQSIMTALTEAFINMPPDGLAIGLISKLATGKSPVTLKAQAIIEAFLKSKGLDGKACLRGWFTSKTDDPEFAFLQNLNELCELETRQPGAAATLSREFGIINFGRYRTDTLLTQYAERDMQDKPYGTVIFPLFDHNGAFFRDGHLVDQLNKDLQKYGFALRIVECGTKTQLARRLITLGKRYPQKIDFALIGGHGSKEDIRFGASFDEGTLLIEELAGKGVQRSIPKFFKPNPTIILASCSTGQFGGIADEMSRLGATVIAPDRDTALNTIEVSERNGRLVFNVEYNKKSAAKAYSPIRGSH